MKALIVFTLFLAGLTVHAEMIPDGTYAGKGFWRSESGAIGTYETEASVANGRVTQLYTLPDGTTKTWDFALTGENHGFYRVDVSGQKAGEAYCIEKVALCHYSLTGSGLEETLTSIDQNLYRVGSKLGPNGERIFWQESSQRK